MPDYIGRGLDREGKLVVRHPSDAWRFCTGCGPSELGLVLNDN